MSLFPFKHPGISDIDLLVIICVGAAVILTLLVYLSWVLCCRHARHQLPQMMKATTLDPELRLKPSIIRRNETWKRIPNRSELTEREARELVKLNPSFNQHILIPDPLPRSTPPSPLLPSPTFSHFTHASSSPLLSSKGPSPSPSLPEVQPSLSQIPLLLPRVSPSSSKASVHLPRVPRRSRSSPERKHLGPSNQQEIDQCTMSSEGYSTDITDIGTSMTGDWEGVFKAVPIERALLMNIRNHSLEDIAGRQKATRATSKEGRKRVK